MIAYPKIDPEVFSLGPVTIYWYGLMYLLAFALAWWLAHYRAQRENSVIQPEQVGDLIFYGALGVVLGGRIGSVLFYNFPAFLADPWTLFKIWQGGMSFHGGVLGVWVAMAYYRRKVGCGFFELTDFVVPLVPLGLAAGRFGNFINAELWGAPSDVPWAMKLSCDLFPPTHYIDFAGPICQYPRHPSQLYEMVLEGFLLFIVLWLLSARPKPTMLLTGCFLLFYGLARSSVELIRLPDAHVGYLLDTTWLTRGIFLSVPMVAVGFILILYAWKARKYASIP